MARLPLVAACLAAFALALSTGTPAQAAEGTLTWNMYSISETDPNRTDYYSAQERQYQVTVENPAPGCHTIAEDARYKREHTGERFLHQVVKQFQNDTDQDLMLIDAPCNPDNDLNMPSGSFQRLATIRSGNATFDWPENARSLVIG